jgi:predicted Zn finger-like uncharacterized protein
MSLITKCPVCATMFKVVPDQLRVSDGWVRCGQCNEVFDANLNLQAATEHLISAKTVDVMQKSGTALAECEPPTDLAASASPPAVVAEADEDGGNDPFLAVNPHALHFEPEALSVQPREPQLNTDELEHISVLPPVSKDDESQAGDSAAEHSFLKPKEVSSVWKRRSVRAVLSVFALVLGAMLVLQIVFQERDRIAASWPATRESLEAMCSAAGCTVGPLRQIEAVVIDSSSFTKVRADVYRLSFSLKNTAHIEVATPAVELTLTDMQDQPVIRRVFTAMDFEDKSGVLDPGSERSFTVPLNVKLAASSEKISGYRLLSFYP